MDKKIYRLIDANINRALEGLRVVEDICRFILDDKKMTAKMKKMRHLIKSFSSSAGTFKLKLNRDILKDVGKTSIRSEKGRKNVLDIFRSNIKRIQESTRVLEEFSKLVDVKYSDKFKKMRYGIYNIDKKATITLQKLQKA